MNTENKKRVMTLRLTDAEWLQLEAESKRLGRTKVEIVRELIRGLPKPGS
jgi:predicted DNA-binding protein